MDWIRPESLDRLEAELSAARTGPLWIVKHSTRCGASAHGLLQVERFRRQGPGGDWLLIEVPRERAMAVAAAERTGVRHESPQVILWVAGRAAWSASHWRVEVDELARAAASAATTEAPP